MASCTHRLKRAPSMAGSITMGSIVSMHMQINSIRSWLFCTHRLKRAPSMAGSIAMGSMASMRLRRGVVTKVDPMTLRNVLLSGEVC